MQIDMTRLNSAIIKSKKTGKVFHVDNIGGIYADGGFTPRAAGSFSGHQFINGRPYQAYRYGLRIENYDLVELRFSVSVQQYIDNDMHRKDLADNIEIYKKLGQMV